MRNLVEQASPQQTSLVGRSVLVTGGGRGLGEAICRSLASAGALVVAADVRRDLAEEVADSIQRQNGQASAIPLDVTNDRSAAGAIEETLSRHGSLDILVNNAGIDVTAAFDDLSMADFDRILAVNLRGPVLLSRLALPLMRRQGRGHIVNVASTAAKRAWPNASAYHASKWGLLGFSYALHAEARRYGVKVTAVIAGGMRTPFLLDRFPDLDPAVLQEPTRVADAIRYVVSLPDETVIPELTVLPMGETSWP